MRNVSRPTCCRPRVSSSASISGPSTTRPSVRPSHSFRNNAERGVSSMTASREPLDSRYIAASKIMCALDYVYMADRALYTAITRGIAVSVEPTYLEAQSSPDSSQYLWAYRVTIENQGRETVQLLSRHWMITNARGELNEVKGPGVVGEQPLLKPGESYEYTSGAPLDTPSGMMGGAYQMESESGERFDIEIPTFSLDRPNQDVLLN